MMGVSVKDLDGLLQLMDKDGNGILDGDEFIEEFTQMRTLIVQTTCYYLLKYVENIQRVVEEQSLKVDDLHKQVSSDGGSKVMEPKASESKAQSSWSGDDMGALPS